MDLQLSGKTALVTGGSRGIGLATARQLAREGASVAIAARNPGRLEAAASSIGDENAGRAIGIEFDAVDDGSVRAMVQRVVEDFGAIDILVNAAGSIRSDGASSGADDAAAPSEYPKLAEITDAMFWDDVNTKLVGYLRCARAAAPHMVARRWGRIINISGISARQAFSIVRSVRNVGISALTKNLADELGPSGINVTVVHPGLTLTETVSARMDRRAAEQGRDRADVERDIAKNAIGRGVTPEEVADVIAFLASPRSVSINGDAVVVGGGQLGFIYY